MGAAVFQRSGGAVLQGSSMTVARAVCVVGDMQFFFVSGTEIDSEVIGTFRRIVTERYEDIAFSSLSESSFAEDWGSKEDAVYDHL